MVFRVRFLSRPPTSWKWAGRGEISVAADQLVVRGRRHRWFLPGKKQEVTIPLADVLDVAAEKRLVRCAVKQTGAPTQTLQFWASDAQAAADIVQLLPKLRTPEFERMQGERDAFNKELDTLAPHALVTPVLVAANVCVFAYTAFAGAGLLTPDTEALTRLGSNWGPYTLDGQWWRLFTSTFLHFGLAHLAFNMWALWSVGRLTERLLGPASFLLLYVFAGLCASLTSVYWHPLLNSAGASGAIFGVLGALLAFMLNPRTRVPVSIAAPQRNSALVFIAYNLFNGFTHTGIDNAAHVGGLLSGFAMCWLLARPLEGQARSESGPRFALGLLGAAAVLAALMWPLVHPSPERMFTREFGRYIIAERAILADQNQLAALINSHAISDQEYGHRVAATLVPRWQAQENLFVATPLPPESRFTELRSKLIDYAGGEHQGLGLLAEAAQTGDTDKLAGAKSALELARTRQLEISALVARLY